MRKGQGIGKEGLLMSKGAGDFIKTSKSRIITIAHHQEESQQLCTADTGHMQTAPCLSRA